MDRVCFEEMFGRTNGKPIVYKGRTLMLADVIEAQDGDCFHVTLETFRSQWRQGVALKMDEGCIAIRGTEYPKGVVIWEDSGILEFDLEVRRSKKKYQQNLVSSKISSVLVKKKPLSF